VQLEGVDSGGIYLLNGQTSKFGLSSNHGLSAQFLRSFFKENNNQSIDRPVFLSKGDIQCSTIVEGKDKSLTAAAIIPIRSEDRTVAILNLASHTHDEIPERVRRALEAISVQIAAYIARINAENMITESKIGIETVTELIDDMFLIVSKDSEVLYANSAFLERFGLSMNSLSKKHIHDLYENNRTEEIASSLRQAFNGKSVTLDVSLSLDDGALLRVTTRMAKAIHDSQPVCYVIVQEIKSQ
jgi:PAS domain S-box-containing protein